MPRGSPPATSSFRRPGDRGSTPRSAVIEVAGGVVMLLLAVLGGAWIWWLLPLALLLHAAWDAAHHDGRISHAVPRWYPSFCAAADLVLAGLYAAVHRAP